MKFLLGVFVIASTVAFAGCGLRSVESYEIEALARACEKHGGIHKLKAVTVFDPVKAVCRDGTLVSQSDGRK